MGILISEKMSIESPQIFQIPNTFRMVFIKPNHSAVLRWIFQKFTSAEIIASYSPHYIAQIRGSSYTYLVGGIPTPLKNMTQLG